MSMHATKSVRSSHPRGLFPPPTHRSAEEAATNTLMVEPQLPVRSAAPTASSPSACCASFRTFRQLRGGQLAHIYIACLHEDTKPFVVKEYRQHCIHRHPSTQPSRLEQKPQREHLILKRMCHPNIVKLHETRSSPLLETTSCIPLEMMGLGSLKDVVSKLHENSNITEDMLTTLAKAVAVPALLGLQFLHANEMIHRDVKPENLLLSREGRVKWCDFDTTYCPPSMLHSSATHRAVGRPDEGIGADTLGVGTDGYMAPELISGSGEKYSSAVDLWSLGVVLYWIVKRSLPEDIKSYQKIGEWLRSNPNREWSGMFQLPAIADDDFRDLLLQLLATNPTRRLDAFGAIHHPSLKRSEFYTGCSASVLAEGGAAAKSIIAVVEHFQTFGVTLYGDDGCERRELDELLRAMVSMSVEQRKVVKDKYKAVVFTRQLGAVNWLKAFFKTHCNASFDLIDEAKFNSWAGALGDVSTVGCGEHQKKMGDI